MMTLQKMNELTLKLGTLAHDSLIECLEKVPSGRLIVLACVAFIVAIVLRYFFTFDPNRQKHLPPGPRPWPLVGNIFAFIDADSIHGKLKELARIHGPMYTIWIGSRPTVIFSGVKLTRDALVKKAGIFSSRPDKYSWNFFTNGRRTLLTTPVSPYWDNLRRIYAKRMLNPQSVQQYAGVRMSEIGKAAEAFRRAQASTEGAGFNPEPIVRAEMANIIVRLNFGDEFDAEGQEIPKGPEGSMISRAHYMEGLCERYRIITRGSVAHLADYIPSLRRLAVSKAVYADYLSLEDEVKDWLLPIVQSRRRELETLQFRPDPSSRENFIDVLLTFDEGQKLTDIEVMWILVELVMGATDTTTMTTQWALTFCLAYPDKQRKLYDEIESVVGHERAVMEDDLPNLPYTQAFVKETLRIKPVVALGAPHSTTQDCSLAGYDIPAKTDVIMHVGKLATDVDIWDSPTEFRPERFLELTDTQKLAFIPFGLGKRICPGMHMGLLQVQITLATLVQKFEWIAGGSDHTVDLSERLHFIVTPKTGVCALIRERSGETLSSTVEN